MAHTTSMDPFDGFDDPIGIGGADVFGHALDDFDIWGDDDDDGFHSGTFGNDSMTKDFPGDDFTVGTEPMSSSDRSSRTYSPKNLQRRSSRTMESSKSASSRITMRPKVTATTTLPITSTEGTEEASGHHAHQHQKRQDHDEADVVAPNSNDDHVAPRTAVVRRRSCAPRRQSKSKLGRETSIRQLITLLNSSDTNLDSKDSFLNEQEEEGDAKKEADQKVGPVVSKSVHHNRTLRTKSRSIRHLSDQTNDPRFGGGEGDSKTMNVPPDKDLAIDDELRKASNRLRDSSRRLDGVHRKARPSLTDELRSASSRHLTNARPSLSTSGTAASRPRRASSMLSAGLNDSTTSAASTSETNSEEPKHSSPTTKQHEPSRRNLVRSTSFGRRKAPSRTASLTASNTSSLGDSHPKLYQSDDEVLEDLQASTPKQEHAISGAITRREPSRRSLAKSTSFSRGKPMERKGTLGIDGALGDSNPKLYQSDDEILEDLETTTPKQEHGITGATTKREPPRRNLARSTSFSRRKPMERKGTRGIDGALGDSNPKLYQSDDEVLESPSPKHEHITTGTITKREPSRRNLVRSTSFGRRKPSERKGTLSIDGALGDSNPRLSLSDDEGLHDADSKLEHVLATPKRQPSRRSLVRTTSFGRRRPPSRTASLTVSIASGDTNPRLSLSDDEVLEDVQFDARKSEPSRGNLQRSMSGRRMAPVSTPHTTSS